MAERPRLRPLGDRAFLVELPAQIDPETSGRVRALGASLEARAGVAETVPAFCTLLVVLVPDADRTAFIRDVQGLLEQDAPARPTGGQRVVVPVAYGGEAGPDLAGVARRASLTDEQVVALHTEREYLVYMVGFSPGFPYLGVIDERLQLPRRASPRMRVPAGSVAIADRLTGIYPQETAGGWHLIGRTGLRLFDPVAEPAALLQPGDSVRFVPSDESAGRAQQWASAPGLRRLAPRPPAAPAVPILRVREPGLAATVQDAGRFGFRRIGVPWSGPMDVRHLAKANNALANPAGAAALEVTWPAPVLEALDDVACAVSGPGWEAVVEGRTITDDVFVLRQGQVLRLARSGRALWAYVAVRGGIDVPPVLGSRATYLRGGLGGLDGRALRAGDVLGWGEAIAEPRPLPEIRRRGPLTPGPGVPTDDNDPLEVRVIPGPQEFHFTDEAFRRLAAGVYTVTSRIDRTGYRLDGAPLTHAREPEILPEGVLPGSIQVPGDEQPIVLMPDGPTTGGYPKIATVVAADLPRLAQAAPGRRIHFRPVTLRDLAGTP